MLFTCLWPEGSYELGSVYPIIQTFYWNWLISFFYIQHGVKGPYGVMHDRACFFENSIFATKMDQG